MTTSGTEAPAAGPLPEAEDPRTAFRVDTVPRSIPEALRGYVVRVRGGDPGGLPAVLGLLVLGVIFAVTTPRFLTAVNVGNLMSQASFIALIGLAVSLFYFYRQKFLAEVQKDFVNNFTHEFKTPLAVMKIASGVLGQDNILHQPDRLERYVTIIKNQTEHLQSQVERLWKAASSESRTGLTVTKCS